MNLGYLKVPPVCNQLSLAENSERSALARRLGFTEFYQPSITRHLEYTSPSKISPEHADCLQVHTGFQPFSKPVIATIEGKPQRPENLQGIGLTATPSVTAQQVISNARQQRGTMSVSWLTKTELAQHWRALVADSTHKGLRARPEHWRVARTILICDDQARAEAAAMSEQSPCRAYYDSVAKSLDMDVETLLEDCVVSGPLHRVLDQIEDLSRTCGPFGTLTLVDHAWPDAEMAENSLASLAFALGHGSSSSRASS